LVSENGFERTNTSIDKTRFQFEIESSGKISKQRR
jgi:hypothetical protein